MQQRIQQNLNDSKNKIKPPKAEVNKDDEDSEHYTDDEGGFDEEDANDGEDALEKIRKAMKKENIRADKHNEKKQLQSIAQSNNGSPERPKVVGPLAGGAHHTGASFNIKPV